MTFHLCALRCLKCEVAWMGLLLDRCWSCGDLGEPGYIGACVPTAEQRHVTESARTVHQVRWAS